MDDGFDVGSSSVVVSLLFDLGLLDAFVVQLAVAHVSLCRALHFGCFDGSTEILVFQILDIVSVLDGTEFCFRWAARSSRSFSSFLEIVIPRKAIDVALGCFDRSRRIARQVHVRHGFE